MLCVGAAVLIALACAAEAASAQQLTRQPVAPNLSFPAGTMEGPSRKIMRLSDGRIHGSFGLGGDVKLFTFDQGRRSWLDVTGGELASVNARSVNSDTGPTGTFISFINDDAKTGEILIFPDPVGNPGRVVRTDALTERSSHLADGFVAASKGEEPTNSVAYGWRDTNQNVLLVGYSSDGRKFPKAKAIVTDPKVKSGPLLAIHNKYVLVSYLSGDPQLKPKLAAAEGKR